jgi:RNA polymerase sigma factor (sigma-70 family)
MDSLATLIGRIRSGDEDAYAAMVARFQDMAVGYAYALLRDFQLAEDAAQEAFFEAYRKLDGLQEPAAFPGWFRRIIYKHCDRITRGASHTIVSLEGAEELPSPQVNQSESMEQAEMRKQIWTAIDSLPEHERSTVVLYYISGYSQKEVCAFLDVPVTTVKKRLYSARLRLRELLMDTLEDTLRERRPSRNAAFTDRLMELLKAARAGDADKVKQILAADPRMIAARDPLGNTALIVAVNSGHHELAELLLSAGLYLDLYEAAAIGNSERVLELITEDPARIDSFSPEGFTPLMLAAHFGHEETTTKLLNAGAHLDTVSKHEIGVTALHAALFGGKTATAEVLIKRGADVTLKRGGKGWPRAGWTALHYGAANGFAELVALLLESGADVNVTDDEGKTPLTIALEQKEETTAELLSRHEQ